MPDATFIDARAPRDWAEAFAAMPVEAPPADHWARVARTLDARRQRHVPAWLGLAAAAAVVAVIAWPRGEPAATGPATARQGAPRTIPTVGATEVATVIPPERREPDPPATSSATPRTRMSTTQVAASAAPTTDVSTAVASRLPALQQESARLEALLAVARDERAGNAGAMLLADAFDDQVAGIDASLTDPDTDDARRERLWQARVDTLRQAAGFVGTQRMFAAQGQGDALLVSVD